MKKKTLRIKKTALTLILSAGIFSSLAAGNAAAAQTNAPLAKLYFVSPHDRNHAKLALFEENRKKTAKKDLDAVLAEMIGEDEDFIARRRSEGKSLEEIAQEYGVLKDFQTAVMNRRNIQLEDLFRHGKISGEEFAEMYDNTDFIAVPSYEKRQHDRKKGEDKSGDVASLLAEVIEEEPVNIQQRLSAGETPWKIAQEAGRFSEYKDAVLENLIATLDERVANGNMTREEADEHIAEFEFEFMTAFA